MELKEVKQYALEVANSYGERNLINKEIEKMYWMEWDDESKVKRAMGDPARITRSPRAANAIDGMIRLLCASDPIFEVPSEINAPIVDAQSEVLEKFATAMWAAAGKITGRPLHYDVVRSAVMFDEIHLLIQSTRELAKAAKGTAREKKADEISQRTPFLYKATHPSGGYPVWDELGLTFFYSKRKVRQIDIMAQFAETGREVIRRLTKGKEKESPYQTVELHDAYDLENRYVWIDGTDAPLLTGAHDYPFIPVVAVKVEGSDIFSDAKQQRHPALYNLYKSGIIERQNLFLSVLYTMIYAIGANPMFVEYLHNPQNPPQVDHSRIGGTVRYRVGERREPMIKQIIDPSLLQGWEISQQLEMESTIYRQTLGEPLGANAPYSMVALLSQSGRLPLLMAQRMGGYAIGRAAELSLKILRSEGERGEVKSSGIFAELSPSDIPEYLEIEAKLDIAMPQDLLSNVNAAVMATQGENPLVSLDWARQNMMQIGQPKEMQEAIWTQNLSDLHYQMYTNNMMQQLQQTRQAAMNPPGSAASGIPGSMPPPPNGNGGGPNPYGTPELAQPTKPFPNIESPYEPAPPFAPPPQARPPEEVI